MEIEQLKKEIAELKAWKKSLESSHSIPLNVDQAFRARFVGNFSEIKSSAKSASSENVTVDEGGATIHTVLNNPDTFLGVTVGTTIYYLPAFT